jgi:hypothetical protein
MTWTTYGVDGRSLQVEQTADGTWLARCEDGPARFGEDLATTLLAAVGDDVLAETPEARAAWLRWAEEHAGHILEETAR